MEREGSGKNDVDTVLIYEILKKNLKTKDNLETDFSLCSKVFIFVNLCIPNF